MSENVVDARTRSERGKGPARRLRKLGMIPAVVYGKGDPLAISVNSKELDAIIRVSSNKLISLGVEGGGNERLVLTKEVQRHPLMDNLVHVDFLEVSLDKKQRLKVPISFDGVSRGVKLGGILNHVKRELDIECLPKDIPNDIPVDISDLDMGQSLHAKDISLPEGIELLNNPMDVLVVVVMPEVEKETTEEAAEEDEATAKAESEKDKKEEETTKQ